MYNVSTSITFVIALNFSNTNLVVSLVSLKEFADICKAKGSEVYLVEWSNLTFSGVGMVIELGCGQRGPLECLRQR